MNVEAKGQWRINMSRGLRGGFGNKRGIGQRKGASKMTTGTRVELAKTKGEDGQRVHPK